MDYSLLSEDIQTGAVDYAKTVLELKRALHLLPISVTTRGDISTLEGGRLSIQLDVAIDQDLRDVPPDVLRSLVSAFTGAMRALDTTKIRDELCGKLEQEALKRLQAAKDDLNHSISSPMTQIEELQQALLDEEFKVR